MNENDGERDQIWERLYKQIRDFLRQQGTESATGKGDFWVVDDNYGWRRHTVYLFVLRMLNAPLITTFRAMLDDLPDWEIAVVVDIPSKENEWPDMGVTIRKREIIDGLAREYLPEPYRSLVIPGSRAGTGYD
jgi:hypothetical protein